MKNVILKRKNRRRNWLVVFILVLTMIFEIGGNNVYADDMYYLSDNTIDGIYAITKLVSGRKRNYPLNLYTMDDRIAYCVDPGIDIFSDNYFATNDFGNFSVSSKVNDKIKKIIYYAYDYPGHDSIYYYMAGQELIWEYLGSDVYWSYTLDDSGYIDIDSYKSEITGLVNNSNLNFNLSNIVYIPYNNQDYIKIYVRELIDFELIDSTFNDVTLEDGYLIIHNDGDLKDKSITVRPNSYTYDEPLLYYNDNSQRMVSSGYLYDNFEYKIDVNIRLTDFTLNVLDSEPFIGNRNLTGSKYELYNSEFNYVATMEIDDNGQAYVDNVGLGTYYLKEVDSGYGYYLDDTIYELYFSDYNNEYTIYKNAILKKISINSNLGNIIYDVYDNNLNYIDSIATDESGYGDIYLPYGEYLISQNNDIAGYEKINNFNVVIDDSDDDLNYKLNYKKVESVVENKDKEIDNGDESVIDVIINPITFDGVYKYIVILFLSLILCLLIKRYFIKLKRCKNIGN